MLSKELRSKEKQPWLAGVHSVTQAMRGELVNDGIRLMGVYPGPIDTDLARGIDMENNTPDNVATAVVQGSEPVRRICFPTPMSSQVGQSYMTNPNAVEEQFSTYVG